MAARGFVSSQVMRAACALVLGSFVSAAAPAGSTGRVTWTTWLRAGPGRDYKVLGEIVGGDQVAVLGCDGDWCRVVSDGVPVYIRSSLITPAAPAAAMPPATACFDSRRAGYEKGELFHYCQR
jgi:uncharacterized protein YgiM (DUF1202 family)